MTMTMTISLKLTQNNKCVSKETPATEKSSGYRRDQLDITVARSKTASCAKFRSMGAAHTNRANLQPAGQISDSLLKFLRTGN